MRPTSRARLSSLLLLALSACSSPTSTSGTPAVSSAVAPMPPSAVERPVDELPMVAADPRERLLATSVAELLPLDHVLRRPMDDKVSQEAFPKYLEALDGGKLFLLQENVSALGKYASEMDDEMKEGDLTLAHKGAALIAKRREVVSKVIKELLASPFDLNVDEQAETDPEKLAWAANEDELKDRWRKVLKMQILERIDQFTDTEEALKKGKPDKTSETDAPKTALEPPPPTLEGKEEKARKDLSTRYETRFTRWASTESLEPAEQFINAIASVYDPHTLYLAPADKEDFDIQLTGKLEGIGAALGEQDHYIVVRELVPGGASWQQGKLEAGDLILAVAQEGQPAVDITDMPIDKVVKMIRGPKNTVVTLTVKKADGHVESISIKRDVVEIAASYARGAVLNLGKKHKPMGYINLPGFYGDTRTGNRGERNATDDVRKLLVSLSGKGVSGVIIDLRGNGGGLLSHARDIAGLFIPSGPVVQTRAPDRKVDVLADGDPTVAFTGNVVIMVDRFSASASEILAGALQDYQRAVVVGTGPTHGKGTVQTLIDLDKAVSGRSKAPLGVFKLTIEQYYRVNGESTQWRGVMPDIVLADPASYVESGERTLWHSIPWSSVEPLPFPKTPHTWQKERLVGASTKRVSQQPVFGKVEAFTKIIKARRDETKVNLKRETWLADRKRNKAALDAADPKLSDSKPRLEVTPVDEPELKAPPKGDKGSTEKVKKRLDKWREDLARDPWVEESLNVLEDMGA